MSGSTQAQPVPEDQPRPRSLSSADQELVCGRSVDDVLEQAADGRSAERDEHQQTCPHCQAALGELADLWAPVAELAHEPVVAPAQLRQLILDQVDKLVQDIWYTLQFTDGGAVRIAARVVATVARDTARLVPGVRVALGRSTQSEVAKLVAKATRRHRHPHAAVGVLGRTAVVDLAVAVTYGAVVDDVARDVQQRVMRELQDNIGLKTVTVNVTVDDVLP